jgi:hypothetical protein
MGIQAATTWQQIYKPQLAAHGDFKIKFHKNSKRRWTSISSQNAMIAVEEALNTTMRTIAALLTIGVLLLATACSKKKKGLLNEPFKIIKVESVAQDTSDNELKDAYIRLYEKDVAIIDQYGNYIQAPYKYNEHTKTLQIETGIPDQPLIFEVEELSTEGAEVTQLKLLGTLKFDRVVKLILEADALYQFNEIDLLHPSVNAWRIKPNVRQSKDEIKNKILSQLDYMTAYFTMVYTRGDQVFNVRHLQAPFAFYANGIGFRDEDALEEWRNIFYDNQDAGIAYTMLKDAMKSIKEYPADKNSYTKGYANVLRMMSNYLKL